MGMAHAAARRPFGGGACGPAAAAEEQAEEKRALRSAGEDPAADAARPGGGNRCQDAGRRRIAGQAQFRCPRGAGFLRDTRGDAFEICRREERRKAQHEAEKPLQPPHDPLPPPFAGLVYVPSYDERGSFVNRSRVPCLQNLRSARGPGARPYRRLQSSVQAAPRRVRRSRRCAVRASPCPARCRAWAPRRE